METTKTPVEWANASSMRLKAPTAEAVKNATWKGFQKKKKKSLICLEYLGEYLQEKGWKELVLCKVKHSANDES